MKKFLVILSLMFSFAVAQTVRCDTTYVTEITWVLNENNLWCQHIDTIKTKIICDTTILVVEEFDHRILNTNPEKNKWAINCKYKSSSGSIIRVEVFYQGDENIAQFGYFYRSDQTLLFDAPKPGSYLVYFIEVDINGKDAGILMIDEYYEVDYPTRTNVPPIDSAGRMVDPSSQYRLRW